MWKAWGEFAKEPDILPIAGPPCSGCRFWKPMRTYTSTTLPIYDGIRLCHGDTMEKDFSCFRERA
jgi:hypothetical protein